jgi:hypothetical protein
VQDREPPIRFIDINIDGGDALGIVEKEAIGIIREGGEKNEGAKGIEIGGERRSLEE